MQLALDPTNDMRARKLVIDALTNETSDREFRTALLAEIDAWLGIS